MKTAQERKVKIFLSSITGLDHFRPDKSGLTTNYKSNLISIFAFLMLLLVWNIKERCREDLKIQQFIIKLELLTVSVERCVLCINY